MIIPSFRPALSYKELNRGLFSLIMPNRQKNGLEAFENKFAQYLGVKEAVCVPSARWGLFLILESLKASVGDEVILPAFTYFAVPAAVVRAGLKPVFVDINEDNLGMDLQMLEKKISSRTRAIIPTHLCGLISGQLNELARLGRNKGIAIIEDAAQSLGAEYKGQKAGSWGDFSYFSFGLTKHFTVLSGGAITTSDEKRAQEIRGRLKKITASGKMRSLALLGKGYLMKLATSRELFPAVYALMRLAYMSNIQIIEKIFHEAESRLGFFPEKGQLNGLQAELGMTQLADFQRKTRIRTAKATQMYRSLTGIKGLRLPRLEEGGNIFSTFPVFVKQKNKVRNILLAKGVDVSSGYMRDCSKLDLFKEFSGEFPNAIKAQEEVIYLPMYEELNSKVLDYIRDVVSNLNYD